LNFELGLVYERHSLLLVYIYFHQSLLSQTFRGPCIVIYSYNKSQRDALFLKFILVIYQNKVEK
jgi:hypothetical protein